MKKLSKKKKIEIWNKHEWEGNILDYGTSSYFKGTEYEKRIETLQKEYNWFINLVLSFEELADKDNHD